jgi:hypothetical protein
VNVKQQAAPPVDVPPQMLLVLNPDGKTTVSWPPGAPPDPDTALIMLHAAMGLMLRAKVEKQQREAPPSQIILAHAIPNFGGR